MLNVMLNIYMEILSEYDLTWIHSSVHSCINIYGTATSDQTLLSIGDTSVISAGSLCPHGA